VRHHLGEKRLLAFYNNDGNFQLWIHLILALAFVPIRSIINIYEEVVLDYLDLHSEEWEEQMPLVEDFRLYIESTYVGKEARSTAGRQRSRRPPLISHDLWNKYDQAIQGQALTNNNSGPSTLPGLGLWRSKLPCGLSSKPSKGRRAWQAIR
jgi:hypothetical protein